MAMQGIKVRAAELKNGDDVRIGGVWFRVSDLETVMLDNLRKDFFVRFVIRQTNARGTTVSPFPTTYTIHKYILITRR